MAVCEHLRHLEELSDRIHAEDAHAPERRVEHLVAAGERTRVRSGSLRRLGSTDFDDNDWLGQRHLASGERNERASPMLSM